MKKLWVFYYTTATVSVFDYDESVDGEVEDFLDEKGFNSNDCYYLINNSMEVLNYTKEEVTVTTVG